ncbi:peptidylprolyl isomerase [Spirochaetia bacterium]|nr:peptidylprolyl isomerase [Spirochaetia bacterium]
MKRFLNVLLLGMAVFAPAFAQSDLQPAAIVRLLKSEPITVKQFRTEVERLEKASGRTLTTDQRWEVLDAMVNEKLLFQAAERDKVTVSEAEVNQQIQELRSQLTTMLGGRQPTEAEFASAVRSQFGVDVPALREEIRRRFLIEKYLRTKKGDVLNAVTRPTEADIQNIFELRRSQFVRPDTIRFQMIQVAMGGDAASRTKAKELADRLAREIGGNPAKFDEKVTESLKPNSGYQAGDGGYLPRNPEAQQLVGDEFIKTAFALKQGEVSKVLESPRGFHIIKVTETHSMKTLTLDDQFQLGNSMTVRVYITNALLQERQTAAYQKATTELFAELRRGNPFQLFKDNAKW